MSVANSDPPDPWKYFVLKKQCEIDDSIKMIVCINYNILIISSGGCRTLPIRINDIDSQFDITRTLITKKEIGDR